jgi:N-acetylmuramoyl-L-alanine amidase
MRHRYCALGLILLLIAPLASAQILLQGLRLWPAPDHTRLVFDLSGPVEHGLFTLSGPDRLVIDLKQVVLATRIDHHDFSQSHLVRIRSAPKDRHDLRVVLDLKGRVRPQSFLLRPNGDYGHRLVVDLYPQQSTPLRTEVSTPPVERSETLRELIVVIDPGHGGEDPGAIGPSRTREKDVVLAIGRRLRDAIASEQGMRPVMVRDSDYFVSLRRRVELARAHRADLLVSIHADGFTDRRAKGASVYTLSITGASSEQARLLAVKENNSDLIGGVSLEDKDDLLASVLLDLSQTATIEASNEAALAILRQMGQFTRLHKKQVEQAGFRILKAPDIPSILVETAFITNPDEERQLRSSSYQQKMAQAIMAGVRSYFYANPPPGTLIAQQQRHVVGRGDTLSSVAKEYQVSADLLRSVNGLLSSDVRIGQILRIPIRGS